MIRSKDRKKAEELWGNFNQPLDYEGYFAGLDELQRANFAIYVVQQKIGDFVMVPSQCVHQVINLVSTRNVFERSGTSIRCRTCRVANEYGLFSL